jgi:hypothetical protein
MYKIEADFCYDGLLVVSRIISLYMDKVRGGVDTMIFLLSDFTDDSDWYDKKAAGAPIAGT